jgi:hypothetical protein
MNMSSQSCLGRHPPPGAQRAEYDFITSPLPSFDIQNLNNSAIGQELQRGISALHIVATDECTFEDAHYLASESRDVIVLNMGQDKLGKGYSQVDWGTTGCSPQFLLELGKE